MIVGQNSLLNQYVPVFYIKDLRDGQGVIYDSVRKAFVNADIGGGSGGATRLGDLLDVSPSVDNPLSLQNGQALVYNTFTSLWENKFIDYNTLLNAPAIPTNSSFSFAALSDTAKPPLPNGYVHWNSAGTQLVYDTTIPASSITGLATVATTGDYNDLINKPATGSGTVTSITVNGTGGRITSSGSPITTSGTIVLDLATTTVTPGTYTAANITIDAFGRITAAANGSGGGGGTVTSVGVTGSTGVSVTGSPITTSGTINISLGAITPSSVAATGTISGTNFTGSSSGTNTGDQTITLTGDVTGSGTGSFATTLANTTVAPGTYTFSTITVDSKGRITSASSGTPSTGTVTSVTVNGTAGNIVSSGSPITTSGSIVLNLANTTVSPGTYTLSTITVDSFGRITSASSGSAGTGTVTSVAVSGGTTGLTTSGGPITTSGTITLAGTLAIANGGTGSTTAQNARNALLPAQTGNSGRFLTTDGTNVSWAVVSGTGTVTSVAASGSNGVTIGGSPITTSGTITIGLGSITPTSVAATGTVTGSNLSGTNTGDQTITLTGDVTGSGTGTFAATLSNTGVAASTYGSATQVPVFTVDAKGRISSVTNTPITGGGSSSPEIVVWHYSSGGSGNFTPVDVLFSQTSGVTATVTDTANCIATYAFTGKSNPPKSITLYGQNFAANTFSITGMPGPNAALANLKIAGGGTSASPDLVNGIFSAANVVTLQTTMANVGASSTIGNRAWLIVVFGF